MPNITQSTCVPLGIEKIVLDGTFDLAARDDDKVVIGGVSLNYCPKEGEFTGRQVQAKDYEKIKSAMEAGKYRLHFRNGLYSPEIELL